MVPNIPFFYCSSTGHTTYGTWTCKNSLSDRYHLYLLCAISKIDIFIITITTFISIWCPSIPRYVVLPLEQLCGMRVFRGGFCCSLYSLQVCGMVFVGIRCVSLIEPVMLRGRGGTPFSVAVDSRWANQSVDPFLVHFAMMRWLSWGSSELGAGRALSPGQRSSSLALGRTPRQGGSCADEDSDVSVG